MTPTAITLMWEGLKQGLAIWPFETRPDEYFALPLYIVIPALMLIVGVPAFVIHWAWGRPPKRAGG